MTTQQLLNELALTATRRALTADEQANMRMLLEQATWEELEPLSPLELTMLTQEMMQTWRQRDLSDYECLRLQIASSLLDQALAQE